MKLQTLDMTCGHCGRAASMKIVATYNETIDVSGDILGTKRVDDYHICQCPACQKMSLCHLGFSIVDVLGLKISPTLSILYPVNLQVPLGLPPQISKAYSEAVACRAVPNAYGVLLGRVLEMICRDKGASNSNLFAAIQELAANQSLPKQLVLIADHLRKLRNVGAHFDLGDLTTQEMGLLDALCRALVEYLYSAPLYLKSAADALAKIKIKKKASP